MADDLTECNCTEFKRLFEMAESTQMLSQAEQLSFEKHKLECRACENWLSQHIELAQMSAALPQFDVSEGLTQKILDSIEKQSTPGVETSIWPVGVAATLAFLVMVPFDSVQSVLSWGAGGLGLLALQMLMKAANSKEQLV